MFKKEIRKRLLVTIIWLAIITFLRLPIHSIGGPTWRPLLGWLLDSLSLCLGGLIGSFLLEIDHLLYTLWIYPHELTSMRVRRLIDQRQFKEAIVLLVNTQNERNRLSFHSALFQPILYILCFFVITSTANTFGIGLVMAMALQLLREEFECLLKGREEHLRRWLFWQIKTDFSFQTQKFFIILMLLIFLGLNWFLI